MFSWITLTFSRIGHFAGQVGRRIGVPAALSAHCSANFVTVT
jgi:hypothetical protein